MLFSSARCFSIPVTLRTIFQRARALLTAQQVALSAETPVPSSPPPPPPVASPGVGVATVAAGGLSRVGQQRRAVFAASAGGRDLGSLHLLSGGSVCENVAPPGGDAAAQSAAATAAASAEMLRAINADKISKNPMLASLLDQDAPSPGGTQQAAPPVSMLSALLDDGRPARKLRKRRSGGGNSPGPGRSPKQSREGGGGGGGGGEPPPPSPLPQSDGGGGVYSYHESHVVKLASTLDNIIKQESRNLSTCQHSELASILNEQDVAGHRAAPPRHPHPDPDDPPPTPAAAAAAPHPPSADERWPPPPAPPPAQNGGAPADLPTPVAAEVSDPFDFGSSQPDAPADPPEGATVAPVVAAKTPRGGSGGGGGGGGGSAGGGGGGAVVKQRVERDASDERTATAATGASKERRKEKRVSEGGRSAKPYITVKVRRGSRPLEYNVTISVLSRLLRFSQLSLYPFTYFILFHLFFTVYGVF